MINFIFLGIIASIFQLVILREFTFSIAKNELSFVIAIGLWLVFCSLGSLAGKRKLFIRRKYLGLAFSLVFCLSVLAIHTVKSFFGLAYYELPSFAFVLAASFLLIGPLSFLTGYGFSLFSKEHLANKPQDKKTFAKFFIFEGLGFFIGGFSFTFFLAGYTNPFIFSFLALLLKRKTLSFLSIAGLGLVFVLGFPALLEREFDQAQILRFQGSGYGPVILAQNYGVESLYANGSLVSTSEDTPGIESFIHTSISSVESPKVILFIGPYFGGQIDEILKHNPENLDLLDINPVISAWSKDKAPNNPKLNFITTDPRLYLKTSEKTYDCIIMSMPAPASLVFNRYFSYQFFELIKKRLRPQGVFSFFIPSKRDILSPNFVKFNSCIINTVDKAFSHRLLIPGDSMIVLAASDNISRQKIISNFQAKNSNTDYFTGYHLADSLDPARKAYIENNINKEIRVNSDFYPLGFLYYLLLQEAKFYPGFLINVRDWSRVILAVFVLLVLGSYSFRFSSRQVSLLFGMAAVGFVSIGLNAVIFLLFQTYSGALFWKLGILTGLFMLALSLGAYLANLPELKYISRKSFFIIYHLLWLGVLLSLFLALRVINSEIVFYAYSCVCGLLTGAAYPLFAKKLAGLNIRKETVAINIYSADLAGAFLGTIILSIFLIPFLGMKAGLLALIFLSFIAILRQF